MPQPQALFGPRTSHHAKGERIVHLLVIQCFTHILREFGIRIYLRVKKHNIHTRIQFKCQTKKGRATTYFQQYNIKLIHNILSLSTKRP